MNQANEHTKTTDIKITKLADHSIQASFFAMGSPCELLFRGIKISQVQDIADKIASEAWRIEGKYSRYRAGNIVAKINMGEAVRVDEETQRLLEYADFCWQQSDGLFDITSGILRKVWRFDGKQYPLPKEHKIKALLPLIGWKKAKWRPPYFQLTNQMEIDLGGIGKEYAVDQCILIARESLPKTASILINFGGDISAYSSEIEPNCTTGWQVGIEQPDHNQAMAAITLRQGALATSGDARRSIMIEGKRYGHILNPQTGWPVPDAPRSITVLSSTCVQAGTLATIAMLQGEGAEGFLEQAETQSWCVR
jgi:thiamine biosynthesis lipoprotein